MNCTARQITVHEAFKGSEWCHLLVFFCRAFHLSPWSVGAGLSWPWRPSQACAQTSALRCARHTSFVSPAPGVCKIFVLLFLWFLGLFVMWDLLAATLQFCTYSCGVVVIHRILDSGSCGTWCTGYFLLYVILLLCGLLKGEGCICVHCGAEGIAEVYINESHQTQPHRVYLNW